MGDSLISVAVTPTGHADAVTRAPADGIKYFVEPHIEKMSMRALLEHITRPARPRSAADIDGNTNRVHYLQSQNGNLYTPSLSETASNSAKEFLQIRDDVPADIPWATEALGHPPDAVNIWIGDERSVTSIHSDPYENIYTVLRGTKYFTLLPPTEGYLLAERTFTRAIYKPRPLSASSANGARDEELEIVPVEYPQAHLSSQTDSGDSDSEPELRYDPTKITWASVDPFRPATSDFTSPEAIEFSMYAQPIKVDVHAGETLYLPSGWWHHVTQSAPSPVPSAHTATPGGETEAEVKRGVCIALNWWYDMEMQGDRWVWLSALRRMGKELAEGRETGQ